MNILIINAGSSSLKYQLIDMENESVKAKGICERVGMEGSVLTHKVPGMENYVVEQAMPSHVEAVDLVLKALLDATHGVLKDISEVNAVGHRVLHGGNVYTEPIIIDEDVKAVIRECFDLGPLHNPANLMGIEACEKVMPGTPNVAVFDTAFGMSMEPKAYMYAIPYKYYEENSLRRYGFHGTSHAFVSGEVIKYLDLPEGSRKVIVCHLGNGSSISASVNGKCVETSMGLTPLEGLVMGTRSGDVDPAVVQYISNHDNMTVDEVLTMLNKKSGLLALSGVSSDFRDLYNASLEGNERATLAIECLKHRIIKYVGAYVGVLNGVDAIAFTGGIGENNGFIRKAICDSFSYLGIAIDDEANKVAGEKQVITTPDSKVKVVVFPTNEELFIARETKRLTQK
ncbi:MAG: acetate kinase [Lachnospiraceae bacterium]|jgi:acetate kinase